MKTRARERKTKRRYYETFILFSALYGFWREWKRTYNAKNTKHDGSAEEHESKHEGLHYTLTTEFCNVLDNDAH